MSQRTLPQSKEALLKSYNSRLKDDVKSMLENYEGNIMHVCIIGSDSFYKIKIYRDIVPQINVKDIKII